VRANDTNRFLIGNPIGKILGPHLGKIMAVMRFAHLGSKTEANGNNAHHVSTKIELCNLDDWLNDIWAPLKAKFANGESRDLSTTHIFPMNMIADCKLHGISSKPMDCAQEFYPILTDNGTMLVLEVTLYFYQASVLHSTLRD